MPRCCKMKDRMGSVGIPIAPLRQWPDEVGDLSQLLVFPISSSPRNEFLQQAIRKGRYKRPVSPLSSHTWTIITKPQASFTYQHHCCNLDEHSESQHTLLFRTSGSPKPCPGINLLHQTSPTRWPSSGYFASITDTHLSTTTSKLYDNKRCPTERLLSSQRDRIHPTNTAGMASSWMD